MTLEVARRRKTVFRLCQLFACSQKPRLARRSKLAPFCQSLAPTRCVWERSLWGPHSLRTLSECSPCISCEAWLKIHGGQAERMARSGGSQCQAKMAGDRERAANKAQKQKDKKKTVIS